MRLALCGLLAVAAGGQTWIAQPSGTTASLRGISAVDANHAWASGTGGTFLRTIDGGKTWSARTVPGAEKLDFRGVVAHSAAGARLMSSGEGEQSGLYATEDGGATWKTERINHEPKGFFDALTASMVLGDPFDGAFALYRLDPWARIALPPALPAEGAFAASNSSLAMQGEHVWFATGGPGAARVFRSADAGETWAIAKTPLRNDAAGAGIFSLFFRDTRNGIAVGGDYAKANENAHNLAVTHDGGVTWTEPGGKMPRGYRSSVAYLPAHKLWITTGPSGSEYSRDEGENWVPFDDGAFHAIGIARDGTCWAVGPKGRIAKLEVANSGRSIPPQRP